MGSRHPPHLSPSLAEKEPEPPPLPPEAEQDTLVAMMARRATNATKPKKDCIPAADVDPVLHPFATNFGPKTLTEYLRAEVEKLKREREVISGKGNGKQEETAELAIPGLSHPSKNQLSTHSVYSTAVAPTLADRVNDCQPSMGLATRRSQRLARRDSAIQNASHCAGSSSKAQLPQPSLPTPFLPDLAQQSSVPQDDFISTPSASSPSRTTTFEEHTKNKRMAVRNTAQEDSTSPLRAKLRQRRHLRGLSLSGPSSARDVSSSASLSDVHHAGTPRRNEVQESHQVSLSENGPISSVCNFPSVPGRETTGDEITEMPSHIAAHGIQNSQTSTEESLTGKDAAQLGSKDQFPPIFRFDYASLIPELIPENEKTEFIEQIRHGKRNRSAGPERRDQDSTWLRIPNYGLISRIHTSRVEVPANGGPKTKSCDTSSKDVSAPDPPKQYPRVWKHSNAPGILPASMESTKGRAFEALTALGPESNALRKFDVDLWTEISRFLSTQDVKNLRLVSKSLARIIAPIQFRNVVVNFDRNFFGTTGGDLDSKSGWLPIDSMFKKYGANINQFGVSFEYDLQGLSHAKLKTIEKEQVAWFGKFTWPTEHYPRFPELQAIEDLVDHNSPLLKEALKSITRASELGLCIDSGHGWLEGPDISDMALFNRRTTKGSKVFGKTFKTEDIWTTFARNEYFRWAQQNTINETIKVLMAKEPPAEPAVKEIDFLDDLKIRDIESFRCQNEQYDYDPNCHIGSSPDPQLAAHFNQNAEGHNLAHVHQALMQRRMLAHARKGGTRLPQWPLIFNGHNIAAEHGGHCPFIQNKTAHPTLSPLLPGSLTEPQAQWLMETVWAQRAFLSAYTTAIITHKQNFNSIHTLRISKLSSGLLPSLEQPEFWKSLSGLKTLEIFISPDWRQEHVTGDRLYFKNMRISPSKAAMKFTNFLRKYIVKIESLHSLSIGYAGGGEHAVGIYARNKHVLPAPIVDDPEEWLFDDTSRKHSPLPTKFDHVRELKFENCWFTPWMLQEFMKCSRDTSLHSLTLDSVSMTPYHEAEPITPIWSAMSRIRCLHPREEWAQENLPSGAAWVRVLDAITPGKTLLEHKYDAGLIDRELEPMPESTFRGHVQQIVLNSCGYAKISFPPRNFETSYNQNSVFVQPELNMDNALDTRRGRFDKGPSVENGQAAPVPGTQNVGTRSPEQVDTKRVMIIDADPSGTRYPWLGTLTQCIHPIEKRVLEEAWQMRFGWPNNLERWAAVEDGQYEGGTGRFSGVIKKPEQTIQEY